VLKSASKDSNHVFFVAGQSNGAGEGRFAYNLTTQFGGTGWSISQKSHIFSLEPFFNLPQHMQGLSFKLQSWKGTESKAAGKAA